jgi:hypothetical protein
MPLKKFPPAKGRVHMAKIKVRTRCPCRFYDAALMQRSSHFKLVETIIDFAKNFNVRLSFRVNPGMYHLSPFYLILFCFSQIHHILNRRMQPTDRRLRLKRKT